MFAIPIAIQDADHGGYRTKTDAWLYLPLKECRTDIALAEDTKDASPLNLLSRTEQAILPKLGK